MSSLALVAQSDTITAPAVTLTPTRDEQPVIEITIAELARIEERLAVQAHLGDLHPAHARRLAAVTAELDRRWAMFI